MSTAPNKRRATYQDLLDAPETEVAEILDGELFTSPRPRGRHALVHATLPGLLHAPFSRGQGGPGGWWFLVEPQLHLNQPEDIVVPDIAGWRRERMPEVPDEVEFRVPPDWVCEIVSPSTERIDRTRKLRIYAQAGVPFAWLVNPVARTLEMFRLEQGRWVLVDARGEGSGLRLEPFDAVDLDLSLVWE